MQIDLSWDLIIVTFVAIVIAYSFIVGRRESVKIIIVTYIALVAVQSIGVLLRRATASSSTILAMLGFQMSPGAQAIAQLLLLTATIVFLAIRGGIDVEEPKETKTMAAIVLTFAFGFATAGLLLCTIITYVAASPLLDATLASSPSIVPLFAQSSLLPYLVGQQELWFALPAALLVIAGILESRK